MTASLQVTRWLRAAVALGREQEYVVGRPQLYAAGVPRWLITREVRMGRWRVLGSQCVVVHNGPLSAGSKRWAAVIEMGPRAALDGVTSLQEAGVVSLVDEQVHVIVPRGARRRRLPFVVVHESRRFREEDVMPLRPRRTKPAVAGVHAALWSHSARQAVLMVTLVVQQRLGTVAQLREVMATVKRSRWRKPVLAMLEELDGGVRSLNELDVGLAMRARGLPEPDRQVRRTRADGTEYLDARFTAYRISLEVDGEQHNEPWARVIDLLRDLKAAVDGDVPVRLPMAAWHAAQGKVLDALEELFRARGWRPAA